MDDFNASTDDGLPSYLDSQGYGWTLWPKQAICTITSNAGWKLKIRGTTSYFTGPYSKPVGDIMWMDGVPGGWHQLTTSDANVHSSSYPLFNGADFGVTFRVLLNWHNDSPGLYTYESVRFTLTSDD